MASPRRLIGLRLGRVYELRKMDEMTNFEIKIGLLRESESRFGLSKKLISEPKGGFQPLSENS